MGQTECKVLTIDQQANDTISAVAHEFGFPAIWYRRARRARQTTEAANYNKGYVFARELDSLRDKLFGFARALLARLTDVANASGCSSDWVEEQTRAGIAQIKSVRACCANWPDEIANKYQDNLTCWIIVACSCRSDPIAAPGWLVRWHPDSGNIFNERDWFSLEETEAIIANIRKWLSAEIEKAIQIAKLEQPRLAQVTEEFKPINEDYTKVRLRSEEFKLTPRQGQIVKVLHEEYKKGRERDLSLSGINGKLTGRKIKKMENAFRSLKKRGQDWTRLIDSPDSGRYRLNS